MAVTARQKPRSPFGNLLREALDENGVSIKELARRIARDTAHVEAKRRLLTKYISGLVSPGDDARAEIARALGIDPARFAVDKEREERRQLILNALIPLADTLLELAIEARRNAEETRVD